MIGWLIFAGICIGRLLLALGLYWALPATKAAATGRHMAAAGVVGLAAAMAGVQATDCPDDPTPAPDPEPWPPTPYPPNPGPQPYPPGPQPTPTPAPYPIPPGPNPTPTTPFETQVMTLFDGSTDEAAVLAGLAGQMAVSIEWDAHPVDENGQSLQPTLKTTNDIGRVWARMQQYRMANGSPFKDRFPGLKNYLGTELANRVGHTGSPQQLDATKRAAAAGFFRELGLALSKEATPQNYTPYTPTPQPTPSPYPWVPKHESTQ